MSDHDLNSHGSDAPSVSTRSFTRVERRSIDYVPRSERHGKAWHLWPVWFCGDAHLTTLAVGVIGASMGSNLFWSAIAIVGGSTFGTFFMAAHSAQGWCTRSSPPPAGPATRRSTPSDRCSRKSTTAAQAGGDVVRGGRLPSHGLADTPPLAPWTRTVEPGVRRTTGPHPPADLNRVFFLQLQILGSTMGTRDELKQMLSFLVASGL